MGDTFEELIAEASEVDVAGWDFSWLDGRATEERPPWGYQKLRIRDNNNETFDLFAHLAIKSGFWFQAAQLFECGHLNWPRLAGCSSRIVAPPGW